MIKRKPYISIIISSNNQVYELEECLASFDKLIGVEVVIINNWGSEAKMEAMTSFLDRLNDSRIIFYQSKVNLNRNQMKNLGINFATGAWLYFIDDCDRITAKFVSFLNHSKLDPKMHFYRLQIMSSNNKKIKFSWFKNKYYSQEMSTFLINGELISQFKLQFEDFLVFNESLLFIHRLYNIKNVNYLALKRIYALYHDFEAVKTKSSFEEVNDSIDAIFRHLSSSKKHWYKQYILIMVNEIYRKLYLANPNRNSFYLFKMKQVTKKSHVWFWHYWFLGANFFFKTFRLRFILIFITFVHQPEKFKQLINPPNKPLNK